MKLNALLRFGIVTAILVFTILPLVAWKKPKVADKIETKAAISDALHDNESPAELSTEALVATYKGHSGCAVTNHEFDVVIDVLDASNNIFRVRNLLDEGETIKAKLKGGILQLGKQKMGSYVVTGTIQYLENPARIETKVKYDDSIGYCEDVDVFAKR
jgi:hypothetical protein